MIKSQQVSTNKCKRLVKVLKMREVIFNKNNIVKLIIIYLSHIHSIFEPNNNNNDYTKMKWIATSLNTKNCCEFDFDISELLLSPNTNRSLHKDDLTKAMGRTCRRHWRTQSFSNI